MVLPVNSLSQGERNALSQCDLEREQIVIDQSDRQFPEIVKCPMVQESRMAHLLRCFQSQPFITDPVKVASYLSKYRWSEAKVDAGYLNVCRLANKILLHNQNDQLFKNISPKTIEIDLSVSSYLGTTLLQSENTKIGIEWNPLLEKSHIEAIVSREFKPCIAQIRMEKQEKAPPLHTSNSYLSQGDLKKMKIQVSQRFYIPRA